MSENPAYERAVERIDRAAAGLPERENSLDGFHPLIEKSEPESYSSGADGLREAAREVSDRRLHPVKEHLLDQMPRGVREVRTLDPATGDYADEKGTFKQTDLRRVAQSLTEDRRFHNATEREMFRAFDEGREYNSAIALEDKALSEAFEIGEMSPEQLADLQTRDPERYNRAMKVAEQYAYSQDVQRQQQQPAEQQQTQTEETRQAHEQEQHQAQVQAEQTRLQTEQARATLTQHAQQLHAEAQDIAGNALQYFPELAQGANPQQLAAHLRATDPQRYALLMQLSQRSQNALNVGQQIQSVATQIDASSNVAQQRQFEAYTKAEDAKFIAGHPELKDRAAQMRVGLGIAEMLQEQGYTQQQIMSLATDPSARSALGQKALYALFKEHESSKAKQGLNEKLKGVPPVQRPGVGGNMSYRDSELSRLDAKPSLNLREAARSIALKRVTSRRG